MTSDLSALSLFLKAARQISLFDHALAKNCISVIRHQSFVVNVGLLRLRSIVLVRSFDCLHDYRQPYERSLTKKVSIIFS